MWVWVSPPPQGAKRSQLPEIHDGDQVGGKITAAAAREFGLTQGTPMLVAGDEQLLTCVQLWAEARQFKMAQLKLAD